MLNEGVQIWLDYAFIVFWSVTLTSLLFIGIKEIVHIIQKVNN
jgi:hypothetical protein